MNRGARIGRLTGLGSACIALLLLSPVRVWSQTDATPYLRPFAEIRLPIAGDQADFSPGFGGGTALEYPLLPFLVPFVRGVYSSNPIKTTGTASLDLYEGDIGLGFALKAGDSFGFRLDAMGGAASAGYLEKSGNAYTAGFRLGASLRVAPAWTLEADGGLSRYYGRDAPFLTVATAGLIASFALSAIGGHTSRLRIEEQHIDQVFPSLYAFYDDHPFGSVRIVNDEDGAVRNVVVSFNAGNYMDQPKVCGQYSVIPSGGGVTVPLTALFTDQVLSITQGIDAQGEIIVDYSFFGRRSEVRFPIDFRIQFRNAITWTDDRRAAAFVSPTNPASLWFSRFAAGIVRDRLRSGINRNLQLGLCLFEAERLYGLNYVVVPANDYSVKHANASIVDSVQFPHQTLQNRGGDCSDLSILYASLLQSIGIRAAFITIPGHIFAALDLGISEEEARSSFYDPDLLIYRDGRAWAPVEITMVRDDFMKAWKVGAKEWYDNTERGQAAFYTLPDCWKVYPAASFPDVDPRFALPDQAEMMRTFDSSLDHFVVRQIDPQVRRLKERLAQADPSELANELGILYGRYGMLREAWAQFSSAAKNGYQSAWDNLGNVAFLRKDSTLALSYYQYAEKLDRNDNIALLGISRCQFELERYDQSDASYTELKSRDLGEAVKYTYLGSDYSEKGRAWSLAERQATTIWAWPKPPKAALAAPLPAASPVPSTETSAQPVSPAAAPAAATPQTISGPTPLPEKSTTPLKPSLPSAAAGAPMAAAGPMAGAAIPTPPEPASATSLVEQPIGPAATAVATGILAPNPAPIVPPASVPPALAALPEDQDIAAAAAAAAASSTAAAPPASTTSPASVPALPAPVAPAVAEPTAPAVALTSPAAAAPVEPAASTPPAAPAAPAATPELPPAASPATTEQTSIMSPPIPTAAVQPPAAAAAPAAVPAPVAAAVPEPTAPAVVLALPAAAAPVESAASTPPAAPAAPASSPERPPAPATTVALAPETPPLPSPILKGFEAFFPGRGVWRLATGSAEQTNPGEYFSKLVAPLVQSGDPYRYEFTARSEGSGFVGFGIHVFVRSIETHKGWGEGRSILVWLTYDPHRHQSDSTRLQIYRSLRDSYMTMVRDIPLPISLFEEHRYVVDIDPVRGSLAVSVDDKPELSEEGIPDVGDGAFVAFRTIGRAIISNFRVEVKK
ncbi:MAG: tetratricopeptide repeat protein [Rectinemataceae bacterium]